MNGEHGRINGLLARNDINSSLDGATDDVAPSEMRDIDVEAARCPQQTDGLSVARTHPDVPLNDNTASPRQTTAQTPRPRNAKRMGYALLKALIAIATAQYVIVTVLAGLTAVTVASTAGKAINAKFELIITALKRF